MKTKQLTHTAVFGGICGAMQAVENMFLPPALPGGKLGLANIIIIICLAESGIKSALAVTIIKSIITLLINGSVTGLAYSLTGGAAAVTAMAFARKIKGITPIGTGVIGAFANNTVQTFVGALITENALVMSYVWMLGPVSVVTGCFTGLVAGLYLSNHRC